MAAEQLPTISPATLAILGTLIAVIVPQLAAFIAAWIRIERRLTRIETILSAHNTNSAAEHRNERATLSILAGRSRASAD